MRSVLGTSAAVILTGASGASAQPLHLFTIDPNPQLDQSLNLDDVRIEEHGETRVFISAQDARAWDAARKLQTHQVVEGDSGLPKRRFERLAASLLREVPFEDGEHHPLETHLAEVLEDHGPEWICGLWSNYRQDSPGMAATLLRCLGMLERYQVADWGYQLMQQALEHKSLRVREAAVMALERWEGTRAIALLEEGRKHECVDWLRDYIRQVLIDLG